MLLKLSPSTGMTGAPVVTDHRITAAQKAGSNSQQTINVGMTVSEAHSVIEDRIAREFGDFRAGSMRQLKERLDQFEESLVAALVKAGRLDAAGDPNLWTAVQRAALEAAGSDGENDIDFLVSLLVERTEEPTDRRHRTVVDGAIKVITALDDETLDGLTALYIVTAFNPRVGVPRTLLTIQDNLLRKALPNGLPASDNWIEHSINLGATRTVPGLKKLGHYLTDRMSVYLAPGVPSDGPEHEEGLRIAMKVGWSALAVGHPYKEGFSVSPFATVDAIRRTAMEKTGKSAAEAAEIADEMRRFWHIGEIDPESRTRFLADLDGFDHLRDYGEWMARLDPPITLTKIGQMVGHVNLKRVSPVHTETGVMFV